MSGLPVPGPQDHPAVLNSCAMNPSKKDECLTDQLFSSGSSKIRKRALLAWALFKKGPLATTGCDHGAFINTLGVSAVNPVYLVRSWEMFREHWLLLDPHRASGCAPTDGFSACRRINNLRSMSQFLTVCSILSFVAGCVVADARNARWHYLSPRISPGRIYTARMPGVSSLVSVLPWPPQCSGRRRGAAGPAGAVCAGALHGPGRRGQLRADRPAGEAGHQVPLRLHLPGHFSESLGGPTVAPCVAAASSDTAARPTHHRASAVPDLSTIACSPLHVTKGNNLCITFSHSNRSWI